MCSCRSPRGKSSDGRQAQPDPREGSTPGHARKALPREHSEISQGEARHPIAEFSEVEVEKIIELIDAILHDVARGLGPPMERLDTEPIRCVFHQIPLFRRGEAQRFAVLQRNLLP